MCDLLWSDPQPQCGRSQSKRGVGTQFGPDITKKFLQKNKLDYVIRSHEVKNDGYEVAHDGKCVTVFSAPNYWYFILHLLLYLRFLRCLKLTGVFFHMSFNLNNIYLWMELGGLFFSKIELDYSSRNLTKLTYI